jgi:transposase
VVLGHGLVSFPSRPAAPAPKGRKRRHPLNTRPRLHRESDRPTGSVDAIIQRAGEALAGPHTQLEQRIKSAAVVNIDETGWKTAGGHRTLWGALSSGTAVFRIAPGRHAFEARTLLGERFAGIVCSDRWRGYDYLEPTQRQLCCPSGQGLHGPQRGHGRPGRVRIRRPRDRTRPLRRLGPLPTRCDRSQLQAQTAPLQDKLRTLLERAARKSPRTKYQRQFAKNLLNRWPALWTFTHTDGVEPTNNHAERGLRGAVMYRKLSLGGQSEQGERTIERLLSASVTCRLRKESLYDHLTQVIAAHARGDPIPGLA